MKLLELIVKNVKREDILDSANFFVQDWGLNNYTANSFTREPNNKESDVEWRGVGYLISGNVDIKDMSEDAATTIITRKELMRAYDLVEQGYTLWFGGDCPVDDGVIFDVILQHGRFYQDVGSIYRWSNLAHPNDIFAYKIKESEDKIVANKNTYNSELDNIIRIISSVAPKISISDAVEIADSLIDEGYHK